jgi:N-acetylmuramoyl-L-alanine amidase
MRRRRAAFALLALVVLATDAQAAPARPGRVERVRYEADGSSTRVIIMLSRPLPFEVRVLGGDPARRSERRVVLDFSNATLGPGATAPIGVENGLLQQIRTGQFTARTARVVLDLASITKHSVDAYEDPPRVVIDIAGKPASVVAAPAPKDRPAPASVPAAPPAAASAAAEKPPVAVRPPRDEPPAGRTPSAGDRAAGRDTPPLRDRAAAAAPKLAATAPQPGSAPVLDTLAAPRAEPVPTTSPKRSEMQAKSGGSDPAAGRPANRPWRIVLDPGHGGNDPGAQGVNGLLEKDVTLAIALRLKRRLEESSNAKVLLTRETDTTRTLAERTAFANANSADLFISIHANADRSGELQGIETYTLNNSNDRATIRLAKMENGPAVRVGRGDLSFILSDMVQSGKEEESNTLAERLHSRVLARLRSRYTDVHTLGVKKGPFYVLVGAYMPCVLIETSFLSHPVEGKRLGTAAYQHDIAEGLYLGITDFLGDARLAKTL